MRPIEGDEITNQRPPSARKMAAARASAMRQPAGTVSTIPAGGLGVIRGIFVFPFGVSEGCRQPQEVKVQVRGWLTAGP